MRKRCIVAVLGVMLIVCATEVFAQMNAALLYLMIKPGARATGVGEAFVATADDAWATYYNPAGLGFQKGKKLGMSHTNWLPAFASDLYHEYLAYLWETEGWGNFGVSIIYMSYGQSVRTDEIGNILGEFRSFDAAVGLSYGSLLTDKSSAGITMKILYSRLAPFGAGREQGKGIGTSYAIDFGYLKKEFLWKRLAVGAALQNLGPTIAYIDADQADPLPQNLKVGIAYDIFQTEFNGLRFSMDLNKSLVGIPKGDDNKRDPFYLSLFTSWTDQKLSTEIDEIIVNVGLEYQYGSWVSLRTGFNRDKYFGEGKMFMTFGAGLKYNIFQFDAAFMPAPETPLSNNSRFSLSINF